MASIGIILSQWDSNWVYAFQGVILMLAVMLNAAIRSRAEKAKSR
jgi:simple sugar transport system permease protein